MFSFFDLFKPHEEKRSAGDNSEYLKLKKKYTQMLRKMNIKPAGKSVIDHYYDLPLDDHSILLSGLGRDVSGNLEYILDELNSNDDFSDFHIYVRTTADETDDKVNDLIRKKGWSRTSTVPSGYDKKLETCRYLLTESYFPYQFIKRPGQIMIDTWHGTPLKCLGVLKGSNIIHWTAKQQKNFLCSDYLLYPNDFTKDIMWRSYRLTGLLKAKSLMMGYPRTAGLLKVTDEEKQKLRKELAPNGEKIYAYMPTLRRYLSDDEFMGRIRPLLSFIDDSLDDSEILFVNLHHYHHQNDLLDCSGFRHIRKFPKDVDSYKFLTVTDALITDYSSVFFDYLILKKQVILYVEDMDEYRENQGLNISVDELPLDIAHNRDELISKIRSGKQYSDTEMIRDLYKYDEEDNPEKLCRIFLNDETGLALYDAPVTDRPKVLLYTQAFLSKNESAMLHDLAENCPDKEYDLFYSCDEKLSQKYLDNAYPDTRNVPTITTQISQPLSSVGRPVLELYKSGKIPFDEAISFLRYEYALTQKRLYGDAQIDLICTFDTDDPEMIISFALSDAPKKMLVLSKRTSEGIRKGKTFLKDAVIFSASYYDSIAVTDKDDLALVSSLVPDDSRDKLRTAESASDLDKIITETLRL